MTFQGTIKNGVVVLDQSRPLAEGTRVEVIVVAEQTTPTLEGVLKLAGTLRAAESQGVAPPACAGIRANLPR